jgi:hypothetical protein
VLRKRAGGSRGAAHPLPGLRAGAIYPVAGESRGAGKSDIGRRKGKGMKRPTIVCLCGSTRFYEAFQEANFRETMAGKIVLSVGFFAHRPEAIPIHGETLGISSEQKIFLDELHKRKIDLADEILVLNVGGYIGESTRSEIDYALEHGKRIRWLEPEKQSEKG